MYLIKVVRTSYKPVEFTVKEKGEALARFMTECSIHAKQIAATGGSAKITVHNPKGLPLRSLTITFSQHEGK